MRPLLFIFLALGIIAAGIVEWAGAAWNEAGPPAQTGNQSVVLIAPHTGLPEIGRQLQDAHLLSYASVFVFDVYLHRLNNRLRAGEYAVPSRASMADIAAILASGKSIQHRLTAAEGLTTDMIYKLVQDDQELTGDPGPEPAEGVLLPETYLFTHGTTRADLFVRMQKAQENFMAARWSKRASGLPFKTIVEAVTLASIVEKETALPEERRHIAAVFINRLKAGMKLQSDPTIIYGISRGYPLGRGIRESELQAATPYNTYVIDALPPTPICNPGKDSLAAVLAPEDSKDLYFVATGQGGHVFAATLAEHQKNVIAFRAQEKLKNSGEVATPPAAKDTSHRHA